MYMKPQAAHALRILQPELVQKRTPRQLYECGATIGPMNARKEDNILPTSQHHHLAAGDEVVAAGYVDDHVYLLCM
jgi:hypothetical protein